MNMKSYENENRPHNAETPHQPPHDAHYSTTAVKFFWAGAETSNPCSAKYKNTLTLSCDQIPSSEISFVELVTLDCPSVIDEISPARSMLIKNAI